MTRFCLDSNVLIQAKNTAYAFDLAPTFWEWLGSELTNGRIVGTLKVYDEIRDGEDELSSWIADYRQYFLIPDVDTQIEFSKIAEFVTSNPQFGQHHVSHFLSGADPWVIAHCMAYGDTIITHEQLVPSNSTKVKIPNVCVEFGLDWQNLYWLMRKLGARL